MDTPTLCPGSNRRPAELVPHDPGRGKRNIYGDWEGRCASCGGLFKTYGDAMGGASVFEHAPAPAKAATS